LAALIQSGDVKFVFSNFVLRPASQPAHEAAECAADQGKFWAYNETLFNNQATGLPKEKLKQFAANLKLDTGTFNQCLDSGKYSKQVLDETQKAARELGIDGTPAFVINGKRLTNLKTFDDVITAVKQELGK
jgi:protein-disulfide isomerase